MDEEKKGGETSRGDRFPKTLFFVSLDFVGLTEDGLPAVVFPRAWGNMAATRYHRGCYRCNIIMPIWGSWWR